MTASEAPLAGVRVDRRVMRLAMKAPNAKVSGAGAASDGLPGWAAG